jgi:predicted transcriptional regulator
MQLHRIDRKPTANQIGYYDNLRLLSKSKGSMPTTRELASYMGTSQTAAMQAIHKLVRKGMLERVVTPMSRTTYKFKTKTP